MPHFFPIPAIILPINSHRCFKAPTILHRKQMVIIPILFTSKQQRSSRTPRTLALLPGFDNFLKLLVFSEPVTFDDRFGLSCSYVSEEEGEDAYCHRVEACLTKESVEDFGSISVSSSSSFSLDELEGNSERRTDTFKR